MSKVKKWKNLRRGSPIKNVETAKKI